jgi:cytidylate kinase
MIITIDGPAASGKSTIARALAQRLGYYYLNSGLLYRAVAYLVTQIYGYTKKRLEEEITHQELLRMVEATPLVYTYDQEEQEKVWLADANITPFLKDSSFDSLASLVSCQKTVRVFLHQLQISLALHHDLVADGRDCGSTVFPYADHKFYLTASLPVRATRWRADQAKRGHTYTLDESLAALNERDKRDLSRQHAPLQVPEKALVIDSSKLSIDQVLELLIQTIQKKEQLV